MVTDHRNRFQCISRAGRSCETSCSSTAYRSAALQPRPNRGLIIADTCYRFLVGTTSRLLPLLEATTLEAAHHAQWVSSEGGSRRMGPPDQG